MSFGEFGIGDNDESGQSYCGSSSQAYGQPNHSYGSSAQSYGQPYQSYGGSYHAYDPSQARQFYRQSHGYGQPQQSYGYCHPYGYGHPLYPTETATVTAMISRTNILLCIKHFSLLYTCTHPGYDSLVIVI